MLAIVVCVWHPATDELLFEGASASLSIQAVRKVVGPSFPEDPEPMTAYPVTKRQGRSLLRMMRKKFSGEGDFQVSREPLTAAVSNGRH